ncbi:hypothetical protein IC582_000345 [Cucumis melo]
MDSLNFIGASLNLYHVIFWFFTCLFCLSHFFFLNRKRWVIRCTRASPLGDTPLAPSSFPLH